MKIDLVSFDHIAGVPIYYARLPVAQYGTRGQGPRTVRLEPTFKLELENCLNEIWQKCPLGAPEILVSGGCYVEKAGRHGEGRAIDIDALWWKGNKSLITDEAETNTKLYLGIEAVLRKHFGTVLDFWYNGAHRDHWHIDNGTTTAWRGGSRARAVFMQVSLNHIFGENLNVDGIAGPATLKALDKVVNGIKTELVPIVTLTKKTKKVVITGTKLEALNLFDIWPKYLDLVCATAFEQYAANAGT
jgi:hypothetical protein